MAVQMRSLLTPEELATIHAGDVLRVVVLTVRPQSDIFYDVQLDLERLPTEAMQAEDEAYARVKASVCP